MTEAEATSGDQPLPFSRLLGQIVREHPADRLTMSQLSALLRDRAWGGLLLTFACINILPLPPGATIITGFPLILLTAQMAAGRPTPWFPRRLDARGVSTDEINRVVAKLQPWERRVERVFKPRWVRMTSHRATRVIGLVGLLLSLIICVPIPLLHHVPAISIALFALALIHRDGALVMLGSLGAMVSVGLASFAVGSARLAVAFVLHRYFGG